MPLKKMTCIIARFITTERLPQINGYCRYFIPSYFNEWYYKFFIFYFVITNEIYVFHKKDCIAQVYKKYTIVIPQQLSKKCND